MAMAHILVPHGDNGVKGKGPEPRKPWRFPLVRRKVASGPDAIRAAELLQQANARRESLPGFSASDQTKAAETAAQPIAQGKNLREAGINVPLRVTKRAIYYPFGKRKLVTTRPVKVLATY